MYINFAAKLVQCVKGYKQIYNTETSYSFTGETTEVRNGRMPTH